jgi:hypothetical protein
MSAIAINKNEIKCYAGEETISCECGGRYNFYTSRLHVKTKIHQSFEHFISDEEPCWTLEEWNDRKKKVVEKKIMELRRERAIEKKKDMATQIIDCKCGKFYQYSHKQRHLKSKYHLDNINS